MGEKERNGFCGRSLEGFEPLQRMWRGSFSLVQEESTWKQEEKADSAGSGQLGSGTVPSVENVVGMLLLHVTQSVAGHLCDNIGVSLNWRECEKWLLFISTKVNGRGRWKLKRGSHKLE